MSYKGRTIVGAVLSVLSAAPSWFGMYLDHPEAFDWLFDYSDIWVPVLVFAFGCFTGYSFSRWSAGFQTPFERARSEKARQAEGFERMRRSFCELGPDLKALMLAALDKGGAYCDGDEWRFSRIPEEPFIAQFIETKYIDGDVAKITALPPLRQFRDSAPDVFAGVSSTLEQHARNRGVRAVASFGTSLDWWWYR